MYPSHILWIKSDSSLSLSQEKNGGQLDGGDDSDAVERGRGGSRREAGAASGGRELSWWTRRALATRGIVFCSPTGFIYTRGCSSLRRTIWSVVRGFKRGPLFSCLNSFAMSSRAAGMFSISPIFLYFVSFRSLSISICIVTILSDVPEGTIY